MNLENVQKLLGFIDEFKKIERSIYNRGQERKENDAEHSYEVMLLSWFLASKSERNLDLRKILLYGLVHDLVEIEAGDTNFSDADALTTKEHREAQALKIIQEKFYFFPELYNAITDYEKQEDDESVFVKSVDKLNPILANMRDNGRSWKYFHPEMNFEKLCEYKEKRIKDEDVVEVWKIIKEELDSKKEQLFKS